VSSDITISLAAAERLLALVKESETARIIQSLELAVEQARALAEENPE
jgi:hypothetical protein